MSPYPCRPLVNNNTIRVFDLSPGKGLVTGRLRVVPLSDQHHYEALSYCWLSELKRKTIRVNGKDFSVTANLHAALKQLRWPDKPRTLWVDQICIDQDNTDERNTQVPIMSQIFANCAQCNVWLGEGDRRTRLALKIIQIQAEWASNLPDGLYYGQHAAMFAQKLQTDPRTRLVGLAYVHKAIHTLTWNPWFLRTWIVQEVAMPRNVRVHCGKQELDWDVIATANNLKFGGISVNLRRLITTRQRVQQHVSRDISWLLALHFSTRATDARDKLYSLFGLLPSLTEPKVDVDYNKPIPTVFMEYTKACLRAVPNLDVLSLAWGCLDQSPDDNVPSWVINYDRNWETDVYPWDVFSYCKERLGKSFEACSNTVSEVRLNGRLLTVSGFQFDVVKKVCDSYISYNHVLQSHVSGLLYFNFKNMIRHNQWYDTYNAWTSTKPNACSEKSWQDDFAQMCAGMSQRSPCNKSAIQETFEAYQRVAHHFRRLARVGDYDVPIIYELGHVILQISQLMNTRFWHTMIMWEQDTTACFSRRLFQTESGRMGLGPSTLKSGDTIVLLKGGSVPYSLRKSGPNWRLVGETYIHGIMHGEAWQANQCHDINIE